ncbi:MAG: transposase [Komagataeibacter saccharivorans]|nr:transposase [Komagataeibacter saccharivorans]
MSYETTSSQSAACQHPKAPSGALRAGTPARITAELIGVNRNTATLYYRKLREVIAEQIAHEAPVSGEIEVDESYFGGQRKGKRGRGAAGKVAVVGLLKRHGHVSMQS